MHAKDAMNREASAFPQSMRAFLSALEAAGELVTISQPVGLDYEIAGCLARVRQRAGVAFLPRQRCLPVLAHAGRRQSAQFAATFCHGIGHDSR